MARSIERRGHHVTCALIGTNRQRAAYNYTSSLAPLVWKTLEYELVDAKGGIQKVRVEPATRSAVATCYIKENEWKKTTASEKTNRTASDDQNEVIQACMKLWMELLCEDRWACIWCWTLRRGSMKSHDGDHMQSLTIPSLYHKCDGPLVLESCILGRRRGGHLGLGR